MAYLFLFLRGMYGVVISQLKALSPWVGIPLCDSRQVQHQTDGYLPSHRASPPLGWYQIILLGNRGTCEDNTSPGSLAESTATRSQNCNMLMIASPAP